MKDARKRRTQLLLLLAVVVIWGILIWRMFNWGDSDAYVTTGPNAPLPLANYEALDTTTLPAPRLDWSDPFGSEPDRRPAAITTTTTPSRPRRSTSSGSLRKIPERAVQFPPIEYVGYSLNGSRVTRVRVRIDGASHTLRLFEEVDGVRIEQMTRDSIVMTKQTARRTYPRRKR